jgi:hypothetical protein
MTIIDYGATIVLDKVTVLEADQPAVMLDNLRCLSSSFTSLLEGTGAAAASHLKPLAS